MSLPELTSTGDETTLEARINCLVVEHEVVGEVDTRVGEVAVAV